MACHCLFHDVLGTCYSESIAQRLPSMSVYESCLCNMHCTSRFSNASRYCNLSAVIQSLDLPIPDTLMSSVLCTVLVVIYRLFHICSHTVMSNREAASTLLVTIAVA